MELNLLLPSLRVNHQKPFLQISHQIVGACTVKGLPGELSQHLGNLGQLAAMGQQGKHCILLLPCQPPRPAVPPEMLLRIWMATVLSEGFGDNAASVRLHFCVDHKWAIRILNLICPCPSYPQT